MLFAFTFICSPLCENGASSVIVYDLHTHKHPHFGAERSAPRSFQTMEISPPPTSHYPLGSVEARLYLHPTKEFQEEKQTGRIGGKASQTIQRSLSDCASKLLQGKWILLETGLPSAGSPQIISPTTGFYSCAPSPISGKCCPGCCLQDSPSSPCLVLNCEVLAPRRASQKQGSLQVAEAGGPSLKLWQSRFGPNFFRADKRQINQKQIIRFE